FHVHSPVAHFARETPDHPALSFAGEEMTYAELEAASNQLARALVERGVRSQDRVGIFLRKGLDLGVAIYGVLKAGGAFVPLDPFLPTERLELILDDCGIRHLVSSDAMEDALGELRPGRDLSVLGVDAVDVGDATERSYEAVSWEEICAQPATAPPDVRILDLDLAYIMYTSGSTGVPKGMMHCHRGSLAYARWGAQHVGLGPQDRVASHAPLHFDLSIFDFFSTSQVGGTVVLVPEPVTKFPASWTQTIQDERVGVVFTVPFTLIDMLERGAMGERDLSSLRWILFGGEPFPPKHLRALMRALPDVRFTNVYGPAEAPSCTCYDVPDLAEGDDEPIPIGTVSANSQDLVLDDDDAECGVGEEGELLIRSTTLTLGYWNRPDLNERVFFTRVGLGPFPEVYFRTGDLVVRHADGLLRFLGRKDRMVKTRGHRVELDEVEAALASHAGVSEAAAFVVPDSHGSRTILAAVTVTAAGDGAPDAADVLRHARTKLPAYAVPREVDVRAALPRTTSGKIDRRRLAEESTTTSET
ncbi:MAG: amino acid adenylation domain-containing protein, partial [Planctomycetota bacterium]